MADSNTNNAKKANKHTRVILPGGIQGLVRDLQNGNNPNAQTVVEQSDNQKNSEANETAKNASQQTGNTAQTAAEGARNADVQQGRAAGNEGAQNANQGAQRESQTAPAEKTEENFRTKNEPVAENNQHIDNQRYSQRGGQYAGQGAGVSAGGAQQFDGQQDRVGEQSASPYYANVRQNGREMSGAVYPAENGQNNGGVAADAQAPTGRGRRPKENTMKEYHIVRDDSKDSWDLFLDLAKQYKDGGGKLATIYIDNSLKNLLDRMKYVGPEKLTTSAILSSIVARFIYDHEDDIRKVLFSGDLL